LVARKKPSQGAVAPSERGLLRSELLPFLTRIVAPRALGNATLINRAAGLFRSCLLILMFEGEARRALQEEGGARELCQAAGGAVSHHHGVGLLKSRALAEQLGDARRMLHGLKRALDPDGIMNPGKLLP